MVEATVHYLNCFTCCARLPAGWRTGTLCLLVDNGGELVLVDTGLGRDDYVRRSAILRVFQALTIVPLDPAETAIAQVTGLGYRPEQVRDIVLTHMHFDHCGGLPDFPWARVHVHRREYEAFSGRLRHWSELAYVRRHIAHRPTFELYDDSGERWHGLPAIRLRLEPEMWLLPLPGHTRGHCGVALRNGASWLFHAGDAGPVALEEYAPRWLVRSVLGPHVERLRAWRDAQARAQRPVQVTTGHMWLDFFDGSS